MCLRSRKGPSQSRLAQMCGAVKRNMQEHVCSIKGSPMAIGQSDVMNMSYLVQF